MSLWVESYQRLKKWYLLPPCLILSIIRYVSRVKWRNPGKGVAPFPTPRCSSNSKGSLRATLESSRKLYFFSLLYRGISDWRLKVDFLKNMPAFSHFLNLVQKKVMIVDQLDASADLHISKSSSPSTNPLMTVTERANYNWYYCHFHVPLFFQFSSKVYVLIPLFAFFTMWSSGIVKSTIQQVFFFSVFVLFTITRSIRLADIR